MTSWEQGDWHWCLTAAERVSCAVAWGDHWQTMITGVLAVGAASWAALSARGQLDAAKNQVSAARAQLDAQVHDAADRRARLLRSARASLPGVLSALCGHAQEVAAALFRAWPVEDVAYPDMNPAAHPYAMIAQVPRFPQEIISPLQQVLEHADDALVLERIASIFCEAQVLDARTQPMGPGVRITIGELVEYILEAAALYARAASLFDFARGLSHTVTGDLWNGVFSALALMEITDEKVLAKGREERLQGLLPGEGDMLGPD